MDMLIFHQNDIDEEQKKKIQAGTPDMPFQFINVEMLFRNTEGYALNAKWNNPICPANRMSTITPPGYKTMCSFFAYKFREYLPPESGYDWMLRVDDDCNLRSNTHANFPPHPLPDGSIIHIMSANWIVDAGGPDSLRDERPGTEHGLLTQGMRRLAYEFAEKHNISHSNKNLFPGDAQNDYMTKIDHRRYPANASATPLPHHYSIYDYSDREINWKIVESYHDRHVWSAPMTNNLYINLTWLYSQPLVMEWMDTVEESRCVFRNRWGDLPIWGATVALANETRYRWDVNMEHTSHRCMYESRHAPLQYPGLRACRDIVIPGIVDYF